MKTWTERETREEYARKHTEYPELDERDREILADRLATYNRQDGPRVGDWIIWREDQGERVYRRISHDWGDEVQTSDEGAGRFHLGDGYVSFSGGLHPSVPVADLVDTGETRPGSCWFFHHDHWRKDNGVDVVAPFRVFAYKGEERLREQLAHWADDTETQGVRASFILHMVDATGYEVGNWPLDQYGEPTDVGRAIRDWERHAGIMARKASDVVTIQGVRATHYGVRVIVTVPE